MNNASKLCLVFVLTSFLTMWGMETENLKKEYFFACKRKESQKMISLFHQYPWLTKEKDTTGKTGLQIFRDSVSKSTKMIEEQYQILLNNKFIESCRHGDTDNLLGCIIEDSRVLKQRDEQGFPPLMIALFNGQIEAAFVIWGMSHKGEHYQIPTCRKPEKEEEKKRNKKKKKNKTEQLGEWHNPLFYAQLQRERNDLTAIEKAQLDDIIASLSSVVRPDKDKLAQEFFSACRECDTNNAIRLLSSYKSLNLQRATTHDGKTGLMLASPEIRTTLLPFHNGYERSIHSAEALRNDVFLDACKQGKNEAVEQCIQECQWPGLLKVRDEEGYTGLMLALKNRHLSTASLILQHSKRGETGLTRKEGDERHDALFYAQQLHKQLLKEFYPGDDTPDLDIIKSIIKQLETGTEPLQTESLGLA